MKKVLFLVLFVTVSTITNARTISLYFTNNSAVADLTIGFSTSSILADLCVWIGTGSFTDVDVCFVERPLAGSIDIQLVDNPGLADISICLTDKTVLANKTFCLTSSITLADICIGVWNSPMSFTKDIYIKNIDPERLSPEAKVAIVYALGLLEK